MRQNRERMYYWMCFSILPFPWDAPMCNVETGAFEILLLFGTHGEDIAGADKLNLKYS